MEERAEKWDYQSCVNRDTKHMKAYDVYSEELLKLNASFTIHDCS